MNGLTNETLQYADVSMGVGDTFNFNYDYNLDIPGGLKHVRTRRHRFDVVEIVDRDGKRIEGARAKVRVHQIEYRNQLISRYGKVLVEDAYVEPEFVTPKVLRARKPSKKRAK